MNIFIEKAKGIKKLILIAGRYYHELFPFSCLLLVISDDKSILIIDVTILDYVYFLRRPL